MATSEDTNLAIDNEWNRRLRAENAVDFEERLVLAPEHLEADVDLGYELILVDEFQDASQARPSRPWLAATTGSHSLSLGDDWQAINRFAGADLSVMPTSSAGSGPVRRCTCRPRCP